MAGGGWQGLTMQRVLPFRNLQYQLVMEKYQMEDKVDLLKQENKKLMQYWVLLQKHLEDLHLAFQDQEEENRDLQTQEHQVGTSIWVRVRSSIISSCNISLSTRQPTCASTHHFTYPHIHSPPPS